MLLRERLERLGDELFRLRGLLPLLALVEVPLAILRAPAAPSPASGDPLALGALAVGATGLLARTLVVGFVPRGTSGRNVSHQKANVLNTTGAYSVVRNPLYVSNFLCWISVSLLLRDPLLLAVNALLFPAFYFVIVLREEGFLEARFGDAYRRYAARVPCVLPQPWLWQRSERRFDLRAVLRREPDTWTAFAVTFFGLQLVWHVLVPGAGALSPGWYLLLGTFLTSWGLLKAAKKLTPLLRHASREEQPAAAPTQSAAASSPLRSSTT